ncbi:MAG: hypothetical protein ACLS3C_10025 [Oscillospiraceae bacterium]
MEEKKRLLASRVISGQLHLVGHDRKMVTRLVEADVPVVANAEQLDIYATPVFNLALIRPAHGGDIVSKAVRNDSVLRFDGDMVKQVFLHEPAVSLLCFHFFLLLYAMEFL